MRLRCLINEPVQICTGFAGGKGVHFVFFQGSPDGTY